MIFHPEPSAPQISCIGPDPKCTLWITPRLHALIQLTNKTIALRYCLLCPLINYAIWVLICLTYIVKMSCLHRLVTGPNYRCWAMCNMMMILKISH